MPGSGERAYVYAKACGITGKSFIGKNLSKLGGLTRLSELDRLVFASDARDLPERELLLDLERRIINRTAKQIITIVDSFSKPPELLARLVRDFEYTDLKRAITAAVAGERNPPALTEIGRFATIDFSAYPHFDKMLKGTEFEFLLGDLQVLGTDSTAPIQNKLDRHFYDCLWRSLLKLAPADRSSIERILAEEISLRNAAWALRMRTYYGMNPEQAQEYLVFIPAPRGYYAPGRKVRGGAAPSLADDALVSLDMALDSPSDWDRWRWVKFLNRRSAGESWTADPRYFQNAAAEYLYHLARHSLRRHPFSLDTAACFIKLKLFEEDLLVSVAEGLSLGMGAQETLELLGAVS
ncbi:V0D/AC39 family V-type ATPase subunit [Treponema primitia]|uniref:V0D/AC39 family V-type ATPase subunit n=1 Tax=Treponema primitia TaxID=88058 RepID=UPI00025557CB|nr:V-type ATPase subunit [Treponema primitia]